MIRTEWQTKAGVLALATAAAAVALLASCRGVVNGSSLHGVGDDVVGGDYGGGSDSIPSDGFEPPASTSVAVGSLHTCVCSGAGVVSCAGDNYSGQLGSASSATCPVPARNGSTSPCSLTLQPVNLPPVQGIVLTWYRSYAVLMDGTVWRWGSDETWESASATPKAIPGLANATAVVAGQDHACARLADSTAACWGGNDVGQLGDGSTVVHTEAQLVPALSAVTQISAGDLHTCVLLNNGTVSCWGFAGLGQLGTPAATTCQMSNGAHYPCTLSPTPVPGLSGVRAIAAGGEFTCALKHDRTVWCWGDNRASALGSATTEICRPYDFDIPCSSTPRPVSSLQNVVGIGLGMRHACAIMADGTVKCWGSNSDGQLGAAADTLQPVGIETEPVQPEPVAVPGLANVTGLALGQRHTCAVRGQDDVVCFGLNNAGQLLDGTTDDRYTPIVGGCNPSRYLRTDLYAINPDTAQADFIVKVGAVFVSSLGWDDVAQQLHAIALPAPGSSLDTCTTDLVAIEPVTGIMTTVFSAPYRTMIGLAKRPSEAVYYSWVNTSAGHYYGKIDLTAKSVTLLADSDTQGITTCGAMTYLAYAPWGPNFLGITWGAGQIIAFDPVSGGLLATHVAFADSYYIGLAYHEGRGKLYALDQSNALLSSIDPGTGATAMVGNISLAAGTVTGIVYDPIRQRLVAAVAHTWFGH